MKRASVAWVGPLALVWLFGCGDGSVGLCPDVAGGDTGFSFTVTGGGGAEVCGVAQSGDREGWGIRLVSAADATTLAIFGGVGGPPEPGTYPISSDLESPGADFVALAIFDDASLGGTFTSATGILTIDASSASGSTGSFVFSAVENGTTGPTIDLRGVFRTIEGDL
ncbi:MAG: hypothetical protein AAF447_11360 [Myxococcota bacterium]